MEISVENPLFYFKLFYVLAYLFIFFAVLYHSLKRGYRIQSILLMLSTITLFTVIGTRLVTIPIQEWIPVIFSNEEVNYDNRSALGGLLFGLVGLIISQRLFGFHKSILDVYAWAAPIGMGIQKIGCFFNGCCFGKPSEIFCAVKYSFGSQVHYSHWSNNLINSDTVNSLNVHPVQLYETFGLVLLGYLIWTSRKYWTKNLSLILFSIVVFLLFRFSIEFIRDPSSSQFEVTYLYGIKSLQWLLLTIALLLSLMLFVYENYLKIDTIKDTPYNYSVRTDLIFILVISCCIYVFSNLFKGYELLTVWMKFIPAVIFTLCYVVNCVELRTFRLALSFILFIPLFVFAQTYQKDSLSVQKFKQIDFGGSFGKFYNEARVRSGGPQPGSCGAGYDYEYLKNSYSIGGVGYSQVSRKGFRENILGVNLHGGNIKSTPLSTNDVESNFEESNFVYGINPYFKHEGKWVGIGVGIQLGNLRKNTTETESDFSDAIKEHHILPEYYFRLGRRDWLDIDYNRGFLMPTAYPTAYHRFSIGSSFGLGPDYNLRYGKTFPLESNFISAKARLSDQIGVNLMYIFKEKNDVYEEGASAKVLFGLNYRFGFKTELKSQPK